MTGSSGAAACRRVLAAAALVLAGATTADAGMDVSLEGEFQRLQEIERQVAASPASREAAAVAERLRWLQGRLEELAPRPAHEVEAERQVLRRQIVALERQLTGLQKVIVDIREASQGGRERLFPRVANRVAVFTFDDPDATGLGDPVSFLLSKTLLFSTRVSSFAIVNYRQGVGRAAGGPAYFDQVDAITRDQGFRLALWGRLTRSGDGVAIESFLQVPAGDGGGPFIHRVRLPEAMGGGTLTVRLKPDRIPVQRAPYDAADVASLRRAAEEVARLRAEPRADAAVVGRLSEAGDFREHQPYRIVDGRGSWVRLRFDDGSGGWTSVDAFCTGACRALMDVAAFTNDIVALAAGQRVPQVPRPVTQDADAAWAQMTAFVDLADDPAVAGNFARPWAQGGFGPPPGGAAFANLFAVARVATALDRARGRHPTFDRIRLPAETLAPIAEDLARASLADPGDVDVVDNLAVLFAAMDDGRRQRLALDIAASLRKTGTLPLDTPQ